MFRGDFLADVVNRNGLTRGAELGLWKGRTFFHLLEHCPQLHMIGVDQWKHCPERGSILGGQTYEPYNLRKMAQFVREHAEPYGRRARIIQASTVEAAQQIEDGALDFVFIDADHSYAGVSADILAWRPKLKLGGYLTGHDIYWVSVNHAVEELVPGYAVHDDDDGGIWYKQI